MLRKNIFALVASVALSGVLLACGGGAQTTTTNTGTTDATTEGTTSLGDKFTSEEYGFSFEAPAGSQPAQVAQEGFIQRLWEDPYLIVYAYVQDEDQTSEAVATMLKEQFDGEIIEQTDSYVVSRQTDASGDINYTKVVIRGGKLYYLDVYYHADEADAMDATAQQILASFVVD
jgi:hypothetical protein